MWRTLPACALLLSLPLAAWADAPPKVNEIVIRMTVQPMPEHKPALKYLLLPELSEMNPGNPIQGYLKSFMEQGNLYYNKQTLEKREKWLVMPLKDLPLQEMQDYKTNSGLRQADWAARLETPDWQVLLQLRRDGANTLLPDVQKMRSLAATLKVRFRVEIAEKHFDDAIVTAKTMLALSRHLGETPTLIGDLVGMSIAGVTLGILDEMIQQPGCPNLFWALTDLPNPFIDIRKGAQGDRIIVNAQFAGQILYEPIKELQHDAMKALSLPYWQAKKVLDNIRPAKMGLAGVMNQLVVSLRKVKGAQARIDQRIALLRCVEALRMYAGAHDGKLPAKLADIDLPLPVDPGTGKPFSYKFDGKTAHLRGDPLPLPIRYEVTIGK